MDPQFVLASKGDFWRLQNEMKNVYATQAEHADRLARLEQRQDGDTRSKSPWNQSPFPSALNGTSQQGEKDTPLCICKLLNTSSIDRAYNPVSEDFKNFDQNLLGSLHLDADEVEPRRGTSRANSVRFDVSASGHGARGSQEYLPLRTGSAIGSHPMTERSSSHKSDGRQSSAGQSTHSARASSFGYETRPLSATVPAFVPLGPPPGLFILGPVPSIVRCWLNQNFRSEAMLYAAVCTGSYRSIVDSSLLSRLGIEDKITTNQEGQRFIKLPVYLPEATLQTTSSRSSSPLHQLPTLTTEFFVQDYYGQAGSMQIFLGCDVLRARNADIHFSLDRLTLFDDERNKVSVQLVRPENAAVYQNLQTGLTTTRHVAGSSSAGKSQPTDAPPTSLETEEAIAEPQTGKLDDRPEESHTQSSTNAVPTPTASSPFVIGEGRKSGTDRMSTDLAFSSTKLKADLKDPDILNNGTTPDAPTRAESSNIWGSWRRDSTQGIRIETAKDGSSSSGYQRPGRGRGMKVLKPARLNTSRSSSIQQQPVGFEAGDPRTADSPADKTELPSPALALDRRAFPDGVKPALPSASSKPRSANPIGGASAFGWLNPSHAQASSGAAD